ncbi:MAG: hypothetical protein AAF958_17560 [Planctomycetota bacterium]
MNANFSDSDASANPAASKFNDPRAKITPRGIGIGVAVFVFASIFAGLSIYFRRTQTLETANFFGPATVESLQLAEDIRLSWPGLDREPILLTATPGLGHLRRALLDQRHYDWQTTQSTGVLSDCAGATIGEKEWPACVRLTLSDTTLKRFEDVEMDLDLAEGWVGLAGQEKRVRVTDHVRPKLQRYFSTTMNVSQLRYDHRDGS